MGHERLESIKLEELMRQGKLTPEDLASLEKDLAEKEAWRSLSETERLRIKEEAYRQYIKKQEAMKSQLSQPFPSPEIGILADGIDNPFHGSSFRQMDRAWRGYVDGNLFTATAGSLYADPLQGEVVVLDGLFSNLKQYSTPTKTGPVRIIEENNGVLILESIVGEYEVYHEYTDTREKVKTPGGEIYYFELRTRTFK